MALFSMRVQVIKRSAGRSAVAAAAYRSGEKLRDERQGITHNYANRSGVEHTEILLPPDAPAWVHGIDRQTLWNAVEANEKRKDAQTARELRIMIPREIPPGARVALVRDFILNSFVQHGMVADVCWHNKIASDGKEQPHAHAMLLMRPVTADGFGQKVRHDWVPDPSGQKHPDGRPVMVVSNDRSWNDPDFYEAARERWENLANDALRHAGSDQRIDRRSLLERGISRLPEPALRLAYYLKDLHGVMKERFGQFQMARHFRVVEARAKETFARLDLTPAGSLASQGAKETAERFFGWFDRQIERLGARPQAAPDISKNPNPDMER